MPETYGLPEPEPERAEQVREAISGAVAGQGIVRAVVLYLLAFTLLVSPFPMVAVVPLVLLIASDPRLS